MKDLSETISSILQTCNSSIFLATDAYSLFLTTIHKMAPSIEKQGENTEKCSKPLALDKLNRSASSRHWNNTHTIN